MEVMEEGNLMDRVPILLQRDLQYYQEHQNVLQERLCPGVVGGKLDFPLYASFAAIKIVLWWEDEYFAAYKRYSGLLHNSTSNDTNSRKGSTGEVIVKNSDPEKFVSLITKCADQFLEHLHCLSQESLDHADLTVLTATIGASALIKNCLWVYLQSVTKSTCPPRGDDKGCSLKLSYKQYSEMTEALAERLLDLHCRLLTLYIIQDSDSLHWENLQTFFESERGSYTIQMWWLYMTGTKHDLWNSVPPKMAQRVFAGMLNETLTVLTSRYIQTIPSPARSHLLLADICNILHCVSELLLCVSEHADDFVGLQEPSQSKIIRDIHAKCHQLFCCLLLRGVPLGVLFKLLRKGVSSMNMFSGQQGSPSPWIIFSLPKVFSVHQPSYVNLENPQLSSTSAIALELKILLSAPQANWQFLVKVLLMRGAALSVIIIKNLINSLPTPDNFKPPKEQPFAEKHSQKQCGGFLCAGECFNVDEMTKADLDPVGQNNYQVILALSYVIIACGKTSDMTSTLVSALDKCQMSNWADCLDKRQVWNQKRPPWFEAILHFIYPCLDCVVQMLVNAAETGASMYQAMSLAITCLSEIWDCIPDGVQKIAFLLEEIVPVSIKLLGDSAIIQILLTGLYTRLLTTAQSEEGSNKSDTKKPNESLEELSPRSTIYYALAEAICSIDEDNKHTDQINLLLKQIKESNWKYNFASSWLHADSDIGAMETLKIDDLEDGLQETPVFRLSDDFDVWNQKRPPWFEAILHFIYPCLDCVVQMLVNAAETGASMYQAMSLAITCLSEIWDCIPDGVQKIAFLLEEIVPVSIKLLGDSAIIQILLTGLYTRLLTTAQSEEGSNKSDTKKPNESLEELSPRSTIYYALAEAICSIDEDNKHTDQINLLLKQIKESNWKYNFASSWLHADSDIGAMETLKIDDLEDGLQETPVFRLSDDFDVENAEYISQLLASDVLISSVGKQCLKILYHYLKHNQYWLLQELGVNETTNEIESFSGQNISTDPTSLLHSMFYIGRKPFDQLLTGSCKIDYAAWLQTPLSLTPERAWLQISQRSEFQDGPKLTIHETAMVAFITNIMKNN